MFTTRAVLFLLAVLASITIGCNSPGRETSGTVSKDASVEQPGRMEPTASPSRALPFLPAVTPAAEPRLVSVAVSAKTAPFLTELDHYTAALGRVTALSVDPAGDRLVAGGGAAAAALWSAHDGHLQDRLKTTSPVLDVAFAPDGTTVATALESGEIQLWDVKTVKPVRTLPAHAAATAIVFHPAGQHLLAGYEDGNLLLWDVERGEIAYTFEQVSNAIEDIAFSLAGRWLVVAADTVYLYELSHGPEPRTLPLRAGTPTTVAFDRQEQQVVVGSSTGQIDLWQLPESKLLRTWSTHQPVALSAAFSPDGETLATGGANGTTLWSTAGGEQLRTLPADGEAVQALAFRTDGYLLFAGNTAGTIAVWGMPVP